MIPFYNDYNDIAHPLVLEKLAACKDEVLYSYGNDPYTKEAIALLEGLLEASADIHFVHGGTMANILALTSNLKPYEAIIAPSSAHIYVHETGAMEHRGHRIIPVDTEDGMLRADDVLKVLDMHGEEFNVLPRIVCISNTTEYGSVYAYEDLKVLYHVCKENGLYLYIDGARLGSAMNSEDCDYGWEDLANICDAMSIGGTKNGAMFGEALVFFHEDLQTNFRFYLKSQGAMMAKGFLIALQFIALFEDGLYNQNAKQANRIAKAIVDGLINDENVVFPILPQSNQIFMYASQTLKDQLDGVIGYEVSSWLDGSEVIRFVTTYRTTMQDVETLLSCFGEE